MTEPERWRPLLSGPTADHARQILDEIAGVGRATATCAPEPFLASGFGARSLFFSYLHRHRSDESFAELAATYLDLAIDALAEKVQPIGLFAGSTGIAWLVEHLHGPAIDDADEDPNESLDEMLLRALTQLPPTADYDLIRGLTGIGVYALERVHRPVGRACLARVVTRLADAAEPRGQGLAWL